MVLGDIEATVSSNSYLFSLRHRKYHLWKNMSKLEADGSQQKETTLRATPVSLDQDTKATIFTGSTEH